MNDHDNAERTSEARGRLRASDADRDKTVERLRGNHEAGRLDAAEFEERMSAALSARYCDELPPLLADLPPERRATADDEAVPPWVHRRRHHHGRAPSWLRPFVSPLAVVLVLLAGLAFVGGLLHGHFAVPLLVGALILWKLRRSCSPWRRHRTQAS